MSSKKESVSDNFLDLLQNRVVIDSDEDIDTSAKVVEKDKEDEQEVVFSTSLLRKRNAQALDYEDESYIGKKIARKSLNHDDDDDDDDLQLEYFKQSFKSNNTENDEESGELDEEDKDNDSESDFDDMSVDEEEEEDNNSESDFDDMSVDEEEEEEDNNSESDFDDTPVDEALPEYENGDVETVKQISKGISDDIAKGIAVRNQLTIWDNLIECRIQLQKSLLNSNRIPKLDSFKNLKNRGGKELNNVISQTTKSVSTLLKKLLEFQSLKLDDFSEIKNLDKTKVEESDEEILSDTENEEKEEEIETISQKGKSISKESDEKILSHTKNEEKEEETETISQNRKRKRKNIEDFEKDINEQYKQFSSYRNNVIDVWNDKTRVMVGKASHKDFSGFEQSTLKQIEQVLSNRRRLLDRTRLKRLKYEIIGEPKNENIIDRDPEIFDDNDFYHQLLRELIEKKSTDVTDSVQLGRQLIELQKLRSKMKRKIDVRASKGRKLHYNIHQKLVSFMAPEDKSSWTDESKTELYKSLFGNKK